MPKNYQLYARILRLVTTYETECKRPAPGYDPEYLFNVARDVIASDADLVWC